jgi:hypothetical protein
VPTDDHPGADDSACGKFDGSIQQMCRNLDARAFWDVETKSEVDPATML